MNTTVTECKNVGVFSFPDAVTLREEIIRRLELDYNLIVKDVSDALEKGSDPTGILNQLSRELHHFVIIWSNDLCTENSPWAGMILRMTWDRKRIDVHYEVEGTAASLAMFLNENGATCPQIYLFSNLSEPVKESQLQQLLAACNK